MGQALWPVISKTFALFLTLRSLNTFLENQLFILMNEGITLLHFRLIFPGRVSVLETLQSYFMYYLI